MGSRSPSQVTTYKQLALTPRAEPCRAERASKEQQFSHRLLKGKKAVLNLDSALKHLQVIFKCHGSCQYRYQDPNQDSNQDPNQDSNLNSCQDSSQDILQD